MSKKWTKENFELFHKEHPEVYELFERFALQASSRRDRYSARGIFHRIRWETMLQNTDKLYKIDNGWSAHYARMFMDKHKHLNKFFQTRVSSYHQEDRQ